MKTLKEKWTEVLPIFASMFFIIGIVYLFGWGMIKLVNYVDKPDTRTVDEIKMDRYKVCLKANNAEYAEWCKNFIK